MRRARVGSVEQAAAFVEQAGLAVVFPSAALVLPSLWEAVAGPGPLEWAVRDEKGKFVAFTPEFDRVWRWKDELPQRRLACAGKHVGRFVSLVAPDLLDCLYALTGRPGRPDDFRAAEGVTPLQREVAEAVLEHGPCSGPELRQLLGTDDKKGVEKATEALQRLCVLTGTGITEQDHGWPAVRLDLFARHWHERLHRLPGREDARRRLAAKVLAAAGALSAADLAAALGWHRREAADTLASLAEHGLASAHEEDGFSVWSAASNQPAGDSRGST